MSEPLKEVERKAFRTRGALYEGDVFSVLKASPWIVRGFEFALADGAIDCSYEYSPSLTFAERYWDVCTRGGHEGASNLLLFDVKSSVGRESHEQQYTTTIAQRQHVAFYIGICAADPTWVEVIPNYYQQAEALACEEEDTKYTRDADASRDVKINYSRSSPLPPSCYGGLSPGGSPYRMPLNLLPEAIRRIRVAVEAPSLTYENPWTKVRFPNWRPRTTYLSHFLRPGEDTDQHSAYQAVMAIYRQVKDVESSLKVDFVGLQPRLADFKLEYAGCQYFVQHKLDTPLRAANSKFERVPVARNQGGEPRYYFSAFDRFDFFWYQFRLSRGLLGTKNEFFFIPEKELPDELFTMVDHEADFSKYAHFQKYRFVMDEDGEWVSGITKVVRDNPNPRVEVERPSRAPHQVDHRDTGRPKGSRAACSSTTTKKARIAGNALFTAARVSGHRRFFYKLMRVCAERRSGLLVVLTNKHPYGDFGYLRYRWNASEVDEFWEHGRSPRAGHHLPPQAEIVAITYYTQHAPATFHGPTISVSAFRRLNSDSQQRLIVWDIGGMDAETVSMPFAVIPSDDIQPTQAQRETLADSEQAKDRPTVSSTLKTALYASEYAVGAGGIASYEGDVWLDLWKLLDRFSLPIDTCHPSRHRREPSKFRVTMQQCNDRLRKQHERHAMARQKTTSGILEDADVPSSEDEAD